MTKTATNRTLINYLAISGVVLILMMIFGLIMLLNQGEIIQLAPDLFYQILTIHGTGMVGIAALAAAAVMWYFLSQYVNLSTKVLKINLGFFLIGVVCVLIGIFAFEYSGAWTFLYPLPTISAGAWGTAGAILYLSGMLILGVGFLIFYLDVSRAVIQKFGSLGKGLGWDYISGKKKGYGPPAAVVASTMVSIVNITALVAGAAVLIMNIITVLNPALTFDPLLAKNLTYAFGHIFANSVIYMAVIAVYELLPKYTNRPWKSNRVFLIAWTMSTCFTIIIFPHHLLMDFALPKWMLILGQALSYANGLPVLVVTAYGALMIVYRSGIRWDIPSGFMFLSMFGWVMGVVPAIVDATIVVNHVMHNTKWVPGHFHMYMGLGACSMIFGFMYYLGKVELNIKTNPIDQFSFWVFTIFFFGLCGSFLFSGKVGAPRRWAEHMPEWVPYDILGAFFAIAVIIAVTAFVYRFIHYANKVGSKLNKKTGHGVNA